MPDPVSKTTDNFKNKDIKKYYPGWLSSKESSCQWRSQGLDPWVRRWPGKGHGNSLIFLPGKSSWTEELGRLHSIESQGVRHNLATKQPQPNVMGHIVKLFSVLILQGIPGVSDTKESACNVGDLGSSPGLWVPWRKAWQTAPVFLPGESPWTGEPGRLQSIGSQRVGHDWMIKHNPYFNNNVTSLVAQMIKHLPTM